MSDAIVIGIDPGVGGALAVLHRGSVRVYDAPTLSVKRGKSIKKQLDQVQWCALVRRLSLVGPTLAVIELVNGFGNVRGAPGGGGQSASAAFAFGRTTGAMECALAAFEIPTHFVAPGKWKRDMSVPADKDGARLVASRLMPYGAAQWPLKKHDGRAEAALLALYGLQHVIGEQAR